MNTTAMPTTIESLFAQNIHRRIEEVIKVDQTDEQILADEIKEYIATDSICQFLERILDRYLETPNQPHEGVGVWVSGFFGSGKSSFAKLLGLALDNRPILGEPAGKKIGERTKSKKVQALLAGINERIPTHAVIFDVATERGILSPNQRLTEIMYRLLLESLGYARDLDLAELEITLEGQGKLADFEARYEQARFRTDKCLNQAVTIVRTTGLRTPASRHSRGVRRAGLRVPQTVGTFVGTTLGNRA
jgi:hypothetical protein